MYANILNKNKIKKGVNDDDFLSLLLIYTIS